MSLLVIASIALLVVLILIWQWLAQALAGIPKETLCNSQRLTQYQQVHSDPLRTAKRNLVSPQHPPYWAA